MTDHITQTNDGAYKSLLYWRKNLWNGDACVPVILTLENKELSMRTGDDAVVFKASLEQAAVKFSGWGTMTIVVAGKKYDIVGMPAATSPAISDLQKAELNGLRSGSESSGVLDKQPAVLGGTIASTAGPAGATVVGAAVSTTVYYRGLASLNEWRVLIGSPADQGRKLNYMTVFIIATVVVLVGAIILRSLNA